MMRKLVAARRVGWLVTLPFSAALLLLAANPAAAAGPMIEASGTFVRTSFVQSNVRTVGGVTRFDFTQTDALSGTLSGTNVLQGSCVVPASGETVCHASETFTGTAAGQSGRLQQRDVTFRDPTTGASHAIFVVVGGTGGLANLHGSGTFQGIMGAGTYTAQVFFAP